MSNIQHADWLKSQGYQRHECNKLMPFSGDCFYQKTIGNDVGINVIVYTPKGKHQLPGGTRYEITSQLQGTITMDISLFTLFEGNLQERLAGIEAYVIELAALHGSKEL